MDSEQNKNECAIFWTQNYACWSGSKHRIRSLLHMDSFILVCDAVYNRQYYQCYSDPHIQVAFQTRWLILWQVLLRWVFDLTKLNIGFLCYCACARYILLILIGCTVAVVIQCRLHIVYSRHEKNRTFKLYGIDCNGPINEYGIRKVTLLFLAIGDKIEFLACNIVISIWEWLQPLSLTATGADLNVTYRRCQRTEPLLYLCGNTTKDWRTAATAAMANLAPGFRKVA